jgi:AraC-like DNA-binding protein
MECSEVPDPSDRLLAAEDHILFICLGGSLTLDVAFEKRQLQRGECFYCSPLLQHKVLFQSSFSGFMVEVQRDTWDSLGYLKYDFMKLSMTISARSIAEDVAIFRTDPSPNAALLSSIVFYAHNQMKARCGFDKNARVWFSHRLVRGDDARVKKAAFLLQEQCLGRVDLEAIAKQAGLSLRNMRRLFQHCFGMSPTEALRSLRMESALPLVSSSKHSIEEISSHCGYESPASFVRDFRLTFSMAPGKFRSTGAVPGRVGKSKRF